MAVANWNAGVKKPLLLGNLNAKRDWGYAPEYVEGMWKILQQPKPDDFVLATGETHTVREFVERAFHVVDIELAWEGEGASEKGISKKTGEVAVGIDPNYYRPTEVDLLIGDASKAKTAFGWFPKTTFNQLVEIMVRADCDALAKR
jgi:GDPmannose 4,6-dehydratase